MLLVDVDNVELNHCAQFELCYIHIRSKLRIICITVCLTLACYYVFACALLTLTFQAIEIPEVSLLTALVTVPMCVFQFVNFVSELVVTSDNLYICVQFYVRLAYINADCLCICGYTCTAWLRLDLHENLEKLNGVFFVCLLSTFAYLLLRLMYSSFYNLTRLQQLYVLFNGYFHMCSLYGSHFVTLFVHNLSAFIYFVRYLYRNCIFRNFAIYR